MPPSAVYTSVTVEAYVSAVRIHVVFALLAYVAVVWFSALHTRVGPRWLLWGELIVQATAIPSAWSHLLELLTFALYGVCAYAWWGHSDGGKPRTALLVATGMAVLLATMVVEAADPRILPMLPADELGLFVLVLVLAVAIPGQVQTVDAAAGRIEN